MADDLLHAIDDLTAPKNAPRNPPSSPLYPQPVERVEPSPEELKALDPNARIDRANAMYKDAVAENLKIAVETNLIPVRDALGLTAEQTRELGKEHVRMLSGAIIPNDAVTVHELIAKHAVTPADAAEQAKWATEARALVRTHYKEEADLMFAAARAMVAKRPALQKLLNDTGLGSHPRVVKSIIDMARRRMGRQPR